MPRDNIVANAFNTVYNQHAESERQKKLLMAEILKAAMVNNPQALQPSAINETMSNAGISNSFLPTAGIDFRGKGDDTLVVGSDGITRPRGLEKQRIANEAAQKRVETQQTGATARTEKTIEAKPPVKSDAEKNKSQLEKIQNQIDELGSVHKSLEVLHDNFNALNQGAGGGVGRIIAGGAQKIPFIPNAATPDTSSYETMRQEIQPQLALALTGSKQGLAAMGKSAGRGLPTATFDAAAGDKNFTELKRQLAEKRLQLYQRKVQMGGELNPQEQADAKAMSGIVMNAIIKPPPTTNTNTAPIKTEIKVGERRAKNGVTYEKKEDGLWHPLP